MMKEIEYWDFECWYRLHFQISWNSRKSWKIGIFEFRLLSYFVRLREWKRRSQFLIKLPVFKNLNVHIYATNLCHFKCWEYCL